MAPDQIKTCNKYLGKSLDIHNNQFSAFLLMNANSSPKQFLFSSPFKFAKNSPTDDLPMTPEWSITPNFCLDDALFTGNGNASKKNMGVKCKELLSITRKGKSIAKDFKRKIKQQILSDLGRNERMIDNILRKDSPRDNNSSSDSPLQPIEIKATTNNSPKFKLFEPELMESILDNEYQNQNVMARKFFNKTNSEQVLDCTKSPNIRERCLKNAEIFENHFMFNLPIPIAKKKSPDNTNPFKDLARHSSELDLGNSPRITDSVTDLVLDYSRSPVVMMRTSGRLESFGDYFDLSKKDSESRFETEFEVLDEIGKGHFGVVTRCRNRLDGLEYAVKITNHKWRGECGKREALQEVFALSALSVCDDNPYIVKYFNGWIEDSKLYIVVIL